MKLTILSQEAFMPRGVAVAFDETVDEIDVALHVFEPLDGIVVEGAEVAGAIELDEATNDGGLVVIFSKGNGGFEVLDNLRDGSTVESTFAPHVSSRNHTVREQGANSCPS